MSNEKKSPLMERRKFLSSAALLGVGAGLSVPAVISNAATAEPSDIALRDRDLRFIGTEETYSTDELITQIAFNDDHAEYLKSTGLTDLGLGRIALMNEAGINIQILSVHTPGVQNVPGSEGIDFAYRLNKTIADGPMAAYPGRFQAFATLPLQDPQASADELERAVQEDGFVGAMTNGIIGDKFLDHPDFEPVLARAEALGVPIYLHPAFPRKEIFDIYYRIDRPELGEVTENPLQKPLGQYFNDNFWITTSAFPRSDLLHLLLKHISVDRVMFATDYPFADMKQQTDWFRAVDLPREAKEKIAFRNAEKLFGINTNKSCSRYSGLTHSHLFE